MIFEKIKYFIFKNLETFKALAWVAFIAAMFFCSVACSPVKYLPIENRSEIHIKDSVVYHDSTIFHHITKEHYKDVSNPLDTLEMETEYSKFKAWNDTSARKLMGEAENKKDSIPERIKWKEKIVYKDSIVTKDVPVPVEVEKKVTPKWAGWSLALNIIILLAIALRIIIMIYTRK